MYCFTRRLLATAVLLTANVCALVSVNAADTVCNFRAKGLSLNFGTLDPSSGFNITKPVTVATTFANMAGDCTGGGNMTVSLIGSSSRQLVFGSNTIDYTITGFPISLPRPGNAPPGNPGNGYATWFTPGGQLQGTILWSAYADAPAGTYFDSITISVNP
jgi:hypothetical protein